MISDTEFVVFGSGSKSPQRDLFMRVLLENKTIIETYPATSFYDQLRSLNILKDSELNIEAVAYRNNLLHFFNRRKNLILSFEYLPLLSYLQGKSLFPAPQICHIKLPETKGIEAGFSGAATLKNEDKIIFTASVEDTNNAYDDGDILGSYIGLINTTNGIPNNTFEYCIIPNTGDKLKIESVTVDDEFAPGKAHITLIADNDNGISSLIKGTITW